MTNLPLVSNTRSFSPVSTVQQLTFPACVPVANWRPSGENATLHASMGPESIVLTKLLADISQILI